MKFPASLKIQTVTAAVCFAVQCQANLVVTNKANSGPGTLRDALAQAQSGDIITFDITGLFTNRTTDLIISNDVSIIGPGPGVLAVTGNSNSSPRIFTVLNGVTASVSGLTLRDCYAGSQANGGAISNGGTLFLTNCVFLRCRAGSGMVPAAPSAGGLPGGPGAHGGAIYNSGSLTVVNCNFYTNIAGLGGYGLAGPNGNGGDSGNGGAIYSSGTLLAMNCNFLTNVAPGGGAGGSGYLAPPTGTGSPDGSPGGNGGHGGAIYATGPAAFINCAFGFNRAGSGGTAGSGIAGTSAHPTGGNGGPGGRGGDGGAIFSLGNLTLTSCTVATNLAGDGSAGGAASSGYYTPGGNGGWGGGGGSGALYCTGSADLTACTFYRNAVGAGGDGADGATGGWGAGGGNGGYGGNSGRGPAIFGNTSNALMTLHNVLVFQNFINDGGSGGWGGSGGGNTIYGKPGTNGLIFVVFDLSGMFTSLGHNFIHHSSGNTGFTNAIQGDIVNPDNGYVYLSQLGRYGGPTLTCPISNPASLVFDAGDDAILASPNITADQRGFPRISGAHVDIGAFEMQMPTTPLVING